MVKTIKKGGGGGGATFNGPAGIHHIPAANIGSSGDDYLFCPVWKDGGGDPDRVVVVTVLDTSTVAIITFSRQADGAWIHDPAVEASDDSVTLSVTGALTSAINAFAIESPGTATDPIVFISTHDGVQTPDTFEMDSIQLADGATSLTAVAVVIAGANQPADTNNMAVVSGALSTLRAMTFFQDDAHFADITGNQAGFTFTYTDAKVLAVDTNIVAGQDYSMFLIGSQMVLYRGGFPTLNNRMWEMTIAAALTEAFIPFAAGLIGANQNRIGEHHDRITAIGGSFATASPVGGGDAAGDESAWIATTFDLDAV